MRDKNKASADSPKIQLICQHPVERLELGLLEGVPVVGPCIVDLELGRFQAISPNDSVTRLSPENVNLAFGRFHSINAEKRQRDALFAL